MQLKGIYFKTKFMNVYVPSKTHFLLLNIRINIKFQSRSVVRNSNKNLKQSRPMFVKTRKYDYNKLCYNKYVSNKYVSNKTQLNELNILEIIWKIFQSDLHGLTQKRLLHRITWLSIYYKRLVTILLYTVSSVFSSCIYIKL